MKQLRFIIIHVTFIILAASCKLKNNIDKSSSKNERKQTTKNIIFLIGDGMGLTQVSSLYFHQKQPPHFNRFTSIGLIKTSSAKQKITDSAAGATAFACGVKTYNGAIGVDADTAQVSSITETLSDYGWKTGVVATSSITHATPACFYAHVHSRSMQDVIALQLSRSDIDFFAGGGLSFFEQEVDGSNPLESLTRSNFEVYQTQTEIDLQPEKKYGFLLADKGMPTLSEGRGDFLPKFTSKAIEYLSLSDTGFFLMIEGSQIDWGGHENNEAYVVTEMVDFDKSVGMALDFAEKNQETLVIVTGDHETGGYSLSSGENYDEIKGSFSTDGHSATLIPIFAYGPGASLFQGIYENNDIFYKILQILKVKS